MEAVWIVLAVILVLAAVLLYFYIKAKRAVEEKASMLYDLAKGDTIITSGGLLGTVETVEGGFVTLQLAPDRHRVRVRLDFIMGQYKDTEE